MKKLVIVFIFIVPFSVTNYAKNPPGTVQVSENLFIDVYEVSNVNWKEYVFWTKNIYGAESKEYKAVLPDTLVWRRPGAYNEPYVQYYYKHPAYNNYPVVGISYKQAVAYCKWRTDRVNEKIYVKENKIDYKPGDTFPDAPKVYQYRLPTKAEWEKVAKVGFSKQALRQQGRKKYRDMKHHNLIYEEADNDSEEELLNDKADITNQVDSYWPNKLGVYNMIGNVGELVQGKIVKGGGWRTKASDVSVETDFKYEKPEDWIGFRCVCEKVKQ